MGQKVGKYSSAEAVAAVEAAGLSLASGKNIGILSALTADQTWSGFTVSFVAGENLTIGQAVYMKNDGRVWKSDANQAATMPLVALATATITAGNAGIFLIIGFFREDSVFNFAVAGLLYASAAATGALTTTAPVGAGDQVQACGQCFPSAHVIYFHPDLTLVELT